MADSEVINLSSDEEEDRRVAARPVQGTTEWSGAQPVNHRRRSGTAARRAAPAGRARARITVHLNQPAAAQDVVDLTSCSPPDSEVVFVGSHRPATQLAGKRRRGAPEAPQAAVLDGTKAQPEASPASGLKTSCPICLDPFKDPACGPCGHIFCLECLQDAVKAQKKCPTCRRTMQKRQVHRVYLS
ncbi:hypothetical protein WJX72_003496 [[Myrmecia] bisecta]|uniref:RING-type domain-containing protein n=1 Tax=[Myrmecia] bisecta TaxID=41462 RepID=A0AAW1QQ07_9CHLO